MKLNPYQLPRALLCSWLWPPTSVWKLRQHFFKWGKFWKNTDGWKNNTTLNQMNGSTLLLKWANVEKHILQWSVQQAVTFTSSNVCRDTRDTAASKITLKQICCDMQMNMWMTDHIRSVNLNMWSISMTCDFFHMDLGLSLRRREQMIFWIEISVVFLRWSTLNLLHSVQQ